MGVNERVGWLGHPVLLAGVAVLIVNDHWAKVAHPGWITGKLSDVAGVVVVGTLLSVLLGRWAGMVACASAFTALKTVPGVAELAAPLLGGLTLRDATDLLGLLGLVGVLLVTRRERRAGPVVKLLALGAAVLATTATGSLPEYGVSLSAVDGTTITATEAYAGSRESTDGGRTWGPGSYTEPSRTSVASVSSFPEGRPTFVCRRDDVCFRVGEDRTRIERREPGGGWTTDFTVTPQLVTDAFAPMVRDPGVRSLEDIAVVPLAQGDSVVASFGVRGVLVREADGTWSRHAIGKALPRAATPVERVLATLWFPALAAAGLGFVLVTDRPRRPRTLRRSLLVLVPATLLVLGVELMNGVMPGLSDPDIRRAWLTGAIVLIGALAIWARRRDSKQATAEAAGAS